LSLTLSQTMFESILVRDKVRDKESFVLFGPGSLRPGRSLRLGTQAVQ